MLEMILILVLVVAAMVAIIVNRKSLLACIAITVVASLLGLGFLVLYANADKFGSHEKLLKFTITSSVIIIVLLIVVTYIGVKMYFNSSKKRGKYVPGPAPEAAGEPRLIPGTDVLAKAVGIFGRQPIERTDAPIPNFVHEVPKFTSTAANSTAAAKVSAETAQVNNTTEKPSVAETVEKKNAAPSAEAMLLRMLEKGSSFKEAGQYLLAEQMYVTYISRCTNNTFRADGELMMLECRIAAGNYEGAKQQLDDLMDKLRKGIYQLNQEQKMKLAECRMDMIKLGKA